MSCVHRSVVVTYYHPFGELTVTIADLVASEPTSTRPVMTLANPRCADCGKKLSKRELKTRIKEGGDLFDPRLKFSW